MGVARGVDVAGGHAGGTSVGSHVRVAGVARGPHRQAVDRVDDGADAENDDEVASGKSSSGAEGCSTLSGRATGLWGLALLAGALLRRRRMR